ncbi:hypothetical protein OG339_07385 [Streptosporangium sp. NBC_01495]|uniref:YncE family protein n=1 Tax=Streptosporangium sp. NBC_01495 TaxID=2903899 RepID=UPI002E335D96|nr:hypothetical protein [Streptosporangium sp. NBC_01495]
MSPERSTAHPRAARLPSRLAAGLALLITALLHPSAAHAAPAPPHQPITASTAALVGGSATGATGPAQPVVLATIGVGLNPRAVAFTPGWRHAYVANSGSDTVSTFDTRTNTVLGEVAVGDDPRWTASGPAGTFLYVTNTGSHSVSVLTLRH